ncbi:MAG TPA: DnaJ domain-containing protein [Pyrinomonadaceae bacterium]|jgi:curved DNA-binding protein CbpA|nr:DnaJ domain-containing protein [Pyrinomonadaceae bacterium]
MGSNGDVDFYEVLQVSDAAEPETINRVYRIFAQRYHPDNRETGNEARFREITEAYQILSNPEKRAQYDATNEKRRRDRWRVVSEGATSENNFELEQAVRLTVLEALYTQRRIEPGNPGIYLRELERMVGRPREHLEFTLWFLNQKKLINSDDSRMYLTADGAEYLEESYRSNLHRKRLQSGTD